MKTRMIILTVLAVGCGATVAMSAEGVQQKDQDRLQTFSPTLQQDRTRLQTCLPAELKTSVQKMTVARDQYKQQLRDKQKEVAAGTVEKREQLRDQLRDQIKEQARDREQIRERLQEMRQLLPSHQELMDQAREQTRTSRDEARRGE